MAISRARFEARVYTDDRAGLPVAIGRENGKFAAMDLAKALQGFSAKIIDV